ncbi:MAG: Golgi apparatus membrane protein tvp23 [Chrysothrix sp. TS-e1954]|nr:MAG: Golgi apparatus membrane protein tvp23 [Chrysothrix sp. TS-e1954]
MFQERFTDGLPKEHSAKLTAPDTDRPSQLSYLTSVHDACKARGIYKLDLSWKGWWTTPSPAPSAGALVAIPSRCSRSSHSALVNPVLSKKPSRTLSSPAAHRQTAGIRKPTANTRDSTGSLLMYLFGILLIKNYILIFILTMLLLAADFYNIKNIAGRRLVGLRWWNEVDTTSGNSHMVFESLPPPPPASSSAAGEGRTINATDKRFFWLALYAQPLLWVLMAVVALVKLEPIWLTLNVIALVLTVTNTVAFSRCDRFGQASRLASSALNSGGMARSLAGGLVGRLFR